MWVLVDQIFVCVWPTGPTVLMYYTILHFFVLLAVNTHYLSFILYLYIIAKQAIEIIFYTIIVIIIVVPNMQLYIINYTVHIFYITTRLFLIILVALSVNSSCWYNIHWLFYMPIWNLIYLTRCIIYYVLFNIILHTFSSKLLLYAFNSFINT